LYNHQPTVDRDPISWENPMRPDTLLHRAK